MPYRDKETGKRVSRETYERSRSRGGTRYVKTRKRKEYLYIVSNFTSKNWEHARHRIVELEVLLSSNHKLELEEIQDVLFEPEKDWPGIEIETVRWKRPHWLNWRVGNGSDLFNFHGLIHTGKAKLKDRDGEGEA